MNELHKSVNKALNTLDSYILINKINMEEWPYKEVRRVLRLIAIQDIKIEERTLRAMKDVYIISFKNFEDTSLHREIDNIDNELRELFPIYQRLEPLGMDFGKGNPI